MSLPTSMLLLFVLASIATAGAGKRVSNSDGKDAVLNVECPQLAEQSTLDAICREARKRFSFSDGCNRVRCLSFGAVKTRRGCPPPDSETSEGEDSCQELADSVFNSLPSRVCSNAAPSRICPIVAGNLESYGRGLPFTDGCNRFGCQEDGSVGAMTRRLCRPGDENSIYCRYFAESQVPDESSAAGQERRRRNQPADEPSPQEFACPSLAIEQVCGPATMGFSYSDGCNHVTCHTDGTGQTSTFKACPAPMGEAGTAYCAQAESTMRAKMARARLRSRCLEPAQVCKDRRRITYYNGCNRCFCTGVGEAACTRAGCPSLLLTDEEFAEHCEKSGAGVH